MKFSKMRKIVGLSFWGLSAIVADATAAEPIKIGASFDLSGPAATFGAMVNTGTKYAVETLNKRGGVLGRPVELQVQDNGTNTQRAVNQATQMARDGIVFLMAPQASGSTLAVSATVSAKLKLPMCVANSAADDITMKSFQPYVYSLAASQYMMYKAGVVRAAKSGFKRIAVLTTDNAAGHIGGDRIIEFNKELNPGSEIVDVEYVKNGAQDFTAALNKILASKPDFVFTTIYGTDIVTMSKQGLAIDFFKQINNNISFLLDSDTLKALGDQAIVGPIGFTRAPFNYLLKQSSEAKEFVEQFKASTGSYPGDETTIAYDCVMTWAAAVEKAKTTDADAVVKALETNEFTSPRGKFRIAPFDHMGNFPVLFGHVQATSEYGQPVLGIDSIVSGDDARPTEAEVLKSRAAN